jgi:hypothetical protein
MFVEGANPIPSRFRRGKKPSAVAVSSTVCNYLEEVVPIAQTVDAFDLADPISFIDKLPKSFYTDIVNICRLDLTFRYLQNGKIEKMPVNLC